jgi:tetratricopeptide (TPR) repeat protein
MEEIIYENSDQAFRFLYHRAQLLYRKRNFPDSLASLSSALTKLRRLKIVDQRYAATLSFLGILHNKLGNFAESKEYHRKAIETWESSEIESPDIAISLRELAFILREEKDFSNSIKLYERLVRLHQKSFAWSAPAIVNALKELAEVELLSGMYDAATTHLDSALAMAASANPALDPEISDFLRAEAATWMARKESELAEVILRKALEIAETESPGGVNHVEILGRLGWVIARKDSGSARVYLEAACDLCRPEFPYELRLSILWSLALVYFGLRFWRGCVSCGESILKILEPHKSFINHDFAAEISSLFNRIPLEVEGILETRQRIFEVYTASK